MFKKSFIKFISIVFVILTFSIGCSKVQHSDSQDKVQYSNFQNIYMEIVEEKDNKTFTKDILEDMVGLGVSNTQKGNSDNGDLNSYSFNSDNEELLVLTDSFSDELMLIKYEKFGDVKLVYSSKEGTDIGGYKPGFTSEYISKDSNLQKIQFDAYIK